MNFIVEPVDAVGNGEEVVDAMGWTKLGLGVN